jgi:hypothetical protein
MKLAADHMKCFAMNAVLGTHQSAEAVQSAMASSFGWNMRLPVGSEREDLELVGPAAPATPAAIAAPPGTPSGGGYHRDQIERDQDDKDDENRVFPVDCLYSCDHFTFK